MPDEPTARIIQGMELLHEADDLAARRIAALEQAVITIVDSLRSDR